MDATKVVTAVVGFLAGYYVVKHYHASGGRVI